MYNENEMSKQIGDAVYADKTGSVLTITGQGPMYPDIGTLAQEFTAKVQKIIVESGVTTIAPAIFADSEDLQTVTIGPDVEEIGAGAFANCAKLRQVEIQGNTLEIIAYEAFSECLLDKINIPKSVKYIGNDAFHGTNFEWNEDFMVINGILVKFDTDAGYQEVPSSVRIVLTSAFQGMGKDVSITLPDTVELVVGNFGRSVGRITMSAKTFDRSMRFPNTAIGKLVCGED